MNAHVASSRAVRAAAALLTRMRHGVSAAETPSARDPSASTGSLEQPLRHAWHASANSHGQQGAAALLSLRSGAAHAQHFGNTNKACRALAAGARRRVRHPFIF